MNYLDTHRRMLSGHGIPEEYVFWSGLWCVGSVVGRSAYLIAEAEPIFLNPIITLVSSKGLDRERRLIELCGDIVGNASINNPVIHDGTISTAILRHRDAFGIGHVAVARPEFPLIGRRNSNRNLDSYSSSRPLSYASNPFVSIITCHTPDYLRKIKPDVWPHILMISRKTASVTTVSPIDITTAVDDLKVIKRHAKPITMAAEAEEFLSNYFGTARIGPSRFEQETAAILPIHTKRTASLITVSDGRDVCTRADIIKGLDAVLKAIRYGIFLYADSSGKAITGARLLRDTLQTGQTFGHKALFQTVSNVMPAKEFSRLMTVMVTRGAVTMYRIRGYGRTYFANQKLKDDVVWMEILRDAGYGYETE